jgi:hypothetical protein
MLLLIPQGSISIGGLCHHAWEMPIDVFEKHMLVCSPLPLHGICLHLIELLHRRPSLHHLQRSHQEFPPDFLPSSLPAEMVQKIHLRDYRFRCPIHYHYCQSAAVWMSAKRDSMGPLLVR